MSLMRWGMQRTATGAPNARLLTAALEEDEVASTATWAWTRSSSYGRPVLALQLVHVADAHSADLGEVLVDSPWQDSPGERLHLERREAHRPYVTLARADPHGVVTKCRQQHEIWSAAVRHQ